MSVYAKNTLRLNELSLDITLAVHFTYTPDNSQLSTPPGPDLAEFLLKSEGVLPKSSLQEWAKTYFSET